MQWWQSQSDQEKKTLLIGGVVVAVLLSYLLVIKPFRSRLNDTREQVAYQTELLQKIRPAMVKIKQLQQHIGSAKKVSSEQLLSVIANALQTDKLQAFATTVRQTDPQKVQIDFKEVPFDTLMDGLEDLWQHHLIHTDRLSLTPLPAKTGLVKAQIVLTITP